MTNLSVLHDKGGGKENHRGANTPPPRDTAAPPRLFYKSPCKSSDPPCSIYDNWRTQASFRPCFDEAWQTLDFIILWNGAQTFQFFKKERRRQEDACNY